MGLLESIANGKYDAHLDKIAQAVKERKEDRIHRLQPGDRVKFGPSTRPTYLQGARATIISWRQSRVIIQLDEDAYLVRFMRGGGKIIAHPASLIPIDN